MKPTAIRSFCQSATYVYLQFARDKVDNTLTSVQKAGAMSVHIRHWPRLHLSKTSIFLSNFLLLSENYKSLAHENDPAEPE